MAMDPEFIIEIFFIHCSVNPSKKVEFSSEKRMTTVHALIYVVCTGGPKIHI